MCQPKTDVSHWETHHRQDLDQMRICSLHIHLQFIACISILMIRRLCKGVPNVITADSSFMILSIDCYNFN